MKTDPLSDSWDFLFGLQPDQMALGELRWPFVILFWVLLVGSFVTALTVWRRAGEGVGPGPFWAWVLRLLIGIMWFQGSLWKMPFPVSSGFQYWTEQMATSAAWPWFGAIVQTVMLPHIAIADALVFAAEMGLAVSLMLGLFVRPVATLGAIYVLGLWIGLYRQPSEWPWEYIFLSGIQAMFAVVGGRYSLGLDSLLAPVWADRRTRRSA